jgi:hypothetical protein
MPLDKKRGKGGKFKRNNKKDISLAAEDLQYLIENISYDATEINEWFRYSFLIQSNDTNKSI